MHSQVIKAFNAVDFFIEENMRRIDAYSVALFNTEQVSNAGGRQA